LIRFVWSFILCVGKAKGEEVRKQETKLRGKKKDHGAVIQKITRGGSDGNAGESDELRAEQDGHIDG